MNDRFECCRRLNEKKVAPRRSHLGGAAGGLVGDIRFERIVGGMNGGLSRVEGRARLADSDGLARSSQVVTPSVQKDVPNVFFKKIAGQCKVGGRA